MPLTSKGSEIMKNMKSEYGPDKGKSVFYASKNKGTISGVDATENEYYEYLDGLRESGITNMIGAAPYLVKKFGVSSGEARTILTKWMQSFEKRHPQGDVKAHDALPLHFACDGVSNRQAQIVDRIGAFVLLEGMALDSGFYFTQGPGGPRKFNARQEALDYIEYAMDAEFDIETLPTPQLEAMWEKIKRFGGTQDPESKRIIQELAKRKRTGQDDANMFEGMDIEKASISYVKPEPMTAAQKFSKPPVRPPSKPAAPPMKRGLLGTPAPDKKLRGRDAELFPGSSQPDPKRAELYRQVNKKKANEASQAMAHGREPMRSNMSRQDLEGMDVDDPEAQAAAKREAAKKAPEPQIHMKDYLKARGQY